MSKPNFDKVRAKIGDMFGGGTYDSKRKAFIDPAHIMLMRTTTAFPALLNTKKYCKENDIVDGEAKAPKYNGGFTGAHIPMEYLENVIATMKGLGLDHVFIKLSKRPDYPIEIIGRVEKHNPEDKEYDIHFLVAPRIESDDDGGQSWTLRQLGIRQKKAISNDKENK